jgi:hypothetical protein
LAGERIRDKIAASKKKGMWMGGLPPLGYDVKDRKLVVNEEEARTVPHIFRRYLELKSVRGLKTELEEAGIRSKQRILSDGTPYGGQKLSRGALYLMLQNRSIAVRSRTEAMPIPESIQPLSTSHFGTRSKLFLPRIGSIARLGLMQSSQASLPDWPLTKPANG